MSLKIFTKIHVLISLIGILDRMIAVAGWINGKRAERWMNIFLVSTILMSVTGFFFPFHGFTPALMVGVISRLGLALAVYARRRHSGRWPLGYAVSAVKAFYLSVFILVVHLFVKVPAFKVIAPEQTEPPFVIAQSVVLSVFVLLGLWAVMKFPRNTTSPAIEKSW